MEQIKASPERHDVNADNFIAVTGEDIYFRQMSEHPLITPEQATYSRVILNRHAGLKRIHCMV